MLRKSTTYLAVALALSLLALACGGGESPPKEPGGESPTQGSAVRKIAYINDGECGGGLYVVNSDGSGEQLIGGGLLETLSWTPDGKRIAFINDEGLQIMDADGKDVQLLLQFPHEGFIANDAHFSPDGSHIAFARNYSVYAVKEDGTGETELMEGQFLGWSPDSNSVFIRFKPSRSTDKGVVLSDSGQIFSAPIDRPGDRRLLFERLQAGPGEVALSPDGTKVAYTAGAGPEGSPPYSMFTADIGSGGKPSPIAAPAQELSGLSFSPDGTQVAYVDREGSSPGLWVSNVDGPDRRQVISGQANDHFSPPVWSPDGSQIAFWAVDGVDVVNVDGSGRERISPNQGKRCPGSQPVWQPLLANAS